MRNKIFVIFFLLIIVVPQVVLAAWWNPFSWFNHWSFQEADSNTQILENRVKELEKKLHDSIGTSTIVSVKQKTSTVQETDVPTPTKEENVAEIVAGFYKTQIYFIDKEIELLNIVSADADRYVKGIPRNVTAIKKMLQIWAPSDSAYNELAEALDNWFDFYIADFAKEKATADKYVIQLQNYQQAVSLQVAKTKTLYIPRSQLKFYSDSITKTTNDIVQSVKIISDSHNVLTDDYVKTKDQLANDIYTRGLTKISNEKIYIPTPSPAPSYSPVRCFTTYFGNQSQTDCY